MGQGSSSVQVHVQLDSPSCYEGDVMTGNVYLHAKDTTNIKELHIKVRRGGPHTQRAGMRIDASILRRMAENPVRQMRPYMMA